MKDCKQNTAGIIILSLIVLFGTINLNASGGYKPQISEPITETWRWQKFPELDGKGCQCMVEAPDKCIYFGVSGGIIRYNGLQWKYFSFGKAFTDISVVNLCVASDGTIYAGTSIGIVAFKNEIWNKLKLDLDFGDPDDFPYNKFPIIETSDKSIWIGSKQGLLRFKNGRYNLYRDDGFYKDIQKNTQQKLRKLKSFDVYTIFEDNAGKIWFGLRDGRTYNCKFPFNDLESNLSMHPVYTEKGYIMSGFPLIKMDKQGRIFIISGAKDGGVNILNNNRWERFSIRKSFKIDDLQNDIIMLKDGSICIGGIGRLFFVKNNQWRMYERSRLPFPSNRIRLFQTSNNYLWIIGLSNDVLRVDLSYNKWATYDNLIFQAEDKQRNRWYISIDGFIVRENVNNNTWTRFDQEDGSMDTPISIFVTRNGKIWSIGSHGNIAATAFFDGKKWIKQLQPTISWGIDRRAVLEGKDNSLWFGSCSDFEESKGQVGGLVRYINSGNSFNYEYYPSGNDFRLYGIYGIGQTPDKDIWVGQLGFYRLHAANKKWEKISSPFGLSQNFVDCIQTSPKGNLWVGTRTNGLFFYNSRKKQWIQYTTKNGLISNTVLDIVCESDGNVWIVSDRDISHFDGTNWTNDIFPGVYKYLRDGVSIKATSDGSIWVNQNPSLWYRRALYKDKSGYVESFRTTRYHPDNSVPQTFITFSMDVVAQPGNVILSWNANDPWKFTPTDKIQYSYRFDEGKWSVYSNKKSEIFLAIASGNHTFEVRARNRDMNVDPTPAKISFYVEPPVWLEPWFVLLLFSFLATLTSFIIHLYHRNKIIQDLSETRARLFTNISHELRTPLTLILGSLTKIVSLTEDNRPVRQPLNLMQRNSRRLLRLVNQILDYRKIEAGQLKFEPCKGDIIDFIHEEFLSFTNEAEAKKIEFSFNSEIDSYEIWFDPDKIEKVMFNLISNALKFTPGGRSVSVNIKLENRIDNNMISDKWLNISVSDTGVGIAPENLTRIFERFYQVNDPAAAITGGTGIGLSVAKEMVKIHLGDLKVESRLGAGTTFYVNIPVLAQETIGDIINSYTINKKDYFKENLVRENTQPSETGTGRDKGKILIVEDNADMREFIKSDLIEIYEVMEAIDGIDGFEKTLTFGPDVIVSDIMMPRMDGIELCKKIKLDERTSHISVMLLTARSSKENMLAGLETGADDYLGKPFNSEELKLRIRNIIETRNKIRERFGSSLKVEPKNIAITSVDEKLIERAIEIIEQHMDDAEFSVETFSNLLGMNRVSLYHKIKSLTNLSPREFFTTIRLKRAAQLIKESGLTITEIAYKVGFKDSSHFSKLFKKQFGKTPKEFMKES
jgi:signal transduction histidine kinase/DNA-binding response OmpR family regulator/ligand-binding sensor domain-containing protein